MKLQKTVIADKPDRPWYWLPASLRESAGP